MLKHQSRNPSTPKCSQYASPSAQVRRTITEFLDSKGLFRGIADNKMSLGLCSRSKDVIEPLMRPQWWVNCKQMAASACAAVRSGDLRILPADCEATWFRRAPHTNTSLHS